MRTRVTLMSDASRDPDTGASGWGGWIASDRGRCRCGGAFRTITNSANAAEMAAIVNVIAVARKNGLLVDGDTLLIQTDCLSAIDGFQGTRVVIDPQEQRATSLFHEATAKMNVTLRHVKAHTRNKDARSLSNNHCDAEAKRHMRAARQQLWRRQPQVMGLRRPVDHTECP